MSADELEEEPGYVNAAVEKPATSGKKIPAVVQSLAPVAVCWVVLLIILALRIYFTAVISAKLSGDMKGSDDVNQRLSNVTRANEKLERVNNFLRRANSVLENNIATLRQAKQQAEARTHELRAENECLKGRPTAACQTGWLHFQSSCYEISSSDAPDQRTWEAARDDCRGKNADLVVVETLLEQDFIYANTAPVSGQGGYWIGLRLEHGRWKWVSGDGLPADFWIQPRVNSYDCLVFAREARGWKYVSCDDRQKWICEKTALPDDCSYPRFARTKPPPQDEVPLQDEAPAAGRSPPAGRGPRRRTKPPPQDEAPLQD